MVADQLRISQGWVRCGMCQSVFDASEDLQTVPEELLQSAVAQAQANESAAVSDVPGSEAVHAPVLEASSADVSSAESIFESDNSGRANEDAEPEADAAKAQTEPFTEESVTADQPAEPSFVNQAKPLLAEPDESEQGAESIADAPDEKRADVDADAETDAAEQSAAASSDATDAPLESVSTEAKAQASSDDSDSDVEVVSDHALLSTDVDEVRREVDAAQPADDEVTTIEKTDVADEPGFVRQARRQAFWHSTGMRVALVLGSVLGLGGMAAQYAWQQRDALAAQYPAVAPALAKACQAMGCELQARREIADVVISGSGFKQLADTHQYQWSLTLENRSEASVATPMAELTLTDAQDKPLLRRVVDLKPLGAPEQLQPHQEWSVNVPVQVQDLSAPVAGYRALVFYP